MSGVRQTPHQRLAIWAALNAHYVLPPPAVQELNAKTYGGGTTATKILMW